MYCGYNDSGVRIEKKIKFKPQLFLKSQKPQTDWIAMDGTRVEPINFDDMREAKDFLAKYKDLNEFKIYGNTNYAAQYIAQQFPNKIDFKPSDVNVVNFDIEVASDQGFPKPDEAFHPIISIALKSSKSSVYEVCGLREYDYSKTQLDMGTDLIRYRKFDSEAALLASFHKYWCENRPDILTGWNIRYFDIPYLINRIKRVGTEAAANKLSPWGIVNAFDTSRGMKGSQVQHGYEILGIQQADYLELFKKFGYSYGPQESYKLDQIAYTVLNEKKLSYEEHGSLFTLYEKDHQKFIDYNIKDVQLVQRIDDKMGLIELCQTMAYKAGVNISDTFGTTAIWDAIIYRELNKKRIALIPNETKTKDPYPGGYVKEPQVGMHDWVVSFDLNSLYPNLIVQYNMSPETLLNGAYRHGVDHYMNNDADTAGKDIAIAANGSSYRKDFQGIIPSIIESYYAERKEIKGEMLDVERAYQLNKTEDLEKQINQLNNRQMAIKILLNSLYGALGNRWFRYFDMRMAEGITLSGQLAIKWSERCVNTEMNKIMGTEKVDYVIAMDTDSLYVNFGPLVKKFAPKDPVKFLDKICGEHFQDNLNVAYDKLFTCMNAYKNRMVMEREGISDKGIWTAKKRYILNVHNNEGVQYAEPKLKIMGIEAIKSSTPEVVREKFREVFKIIIRGDEKLTQDFIADFYNTFRTLSPEQISFPRGVGFGDSTMSKWTNKDKGSKKSYKGGTPIHIRGALLYNGLIDKLGLAQKYTKISDGEKVKFCYLRTPNTIHENVIAFPDYLPDELNLHKYINYDIQFEKTFIDPLKSVIDATGWFINYDNSGTLDEFFG